ncbi:MAG: mechanosensitive ion channel [Saprospiraceae bacterium]|nr:mechanosensitive ion channel [Saprospiraceae bacterium]
MEEKTYLDRLVDLCWLYGPKVVSALLLIIVGLWVIKRLTRAFDMFLGTKKVDPSLRPFFASLCDTGLKAILIIMVASTIGIETTSFIAVFSAVAFSIGLALQGSLGNFASGVLILLFRPFRVGDLLTVADKTGKVSEIQVFSTILMTSSGKKIIIPNGKMLEGPIENIADGADVQAEVSLLVNTKTPLEWLRATVDEVATRCPYNSGKAPAAVQVSGMNREDMKVQIALWTKGETYEEALFFMYEELKKAFDVAGIELAKERRKESV